MGALRIANTIFVSIVKRAPKPDSNYEGPYVNNRPVKLCDLTPQPARRYLEAKLP